MEPCLNALFTLRDADGTIQTYPLDDLNSAIVIIRTKTGEIRAAGFGDMDGCQELTKNVPEVLKSIDEQLTKSL